MTRYIVCLDSNNKKIVLAYSFEIFEDSICFYDFRKNIIAWFYKANICGFGKEGDTE